MPWDERPNYREQRGPSVNPLLWLSRATVPLFRLLDIRFEAHAILLAYIAGVLFLGGEANYTLPVRTLYIGILVVSLLLHELAHGVAARVLGGSATEAVLWPLGGLSAADPPNRAISEFLCAAAGPALNLFLAVASGIALYVFTPTPLMRMAHAHAGHFGFIWNPLAGPESAPAAHWSDPARYFWWTFIVNYRLFAINLLPVLPLDGGTMFQSMVWTVAGHGRAERVTARIGIVGAGVLFILFLADRQWGLAILSMWMLYESTRRILELRDAEAELWHAGHDHAERPHRPRHLSRRVIRRARKIILKENAARQRIDAILAKVSLLGMAGLSWRERRLLRITTERQRRKELELSKFQ